MPVPQPTTFAFALIVTIFYVPLIIMMYWAQRQRRARVELVRALHSILERVPSDDEAIAQIQVVFKKMAERYPYARSHYKNPTDFLEDVLCRAEALGSRFKEGYSTQFTPEQLDRIARLMALLKERQPFGSISSKYGNLLEMIRHAFDTANPDLGNANLRQLADDIEMMESTIESQRGLNRVSIVVSIVGVILTLVFGALTVVQWVVQATTAS